MRIGRWMAGLLLCGSALAQEAKPVWWQAALQHGELNIWMVRKATNADKVAIAQQKLNTQIEPIKNSEERTLAEFGQPASAIGQTAGSYGQTSGSFGANASSPGQAAGSVGKSPSELGTSASNAGRTASSYGQTAGSFGQTASTFGVAASDSNKPAPAKPHLWDPQQSSLALDLKMAFPSLTVRYVDVPDVQLKERLEAAKGTTEYPDVIVGTEYVPWFKETGLGATMLAEWPWFADPGRWRSSTDRFQPGTTVLLREAPHPVAAQAFWLWVTGDAGLQCTECRYAFGKGTEELIRVAKAAMTNFLQGVAMGELADVEAAEYDARAAQFLALQPSGGGSLVETPKLQIEPLQAERGGNLAVVMLQTRVLSTDVVGFLNSVVVLRRDANGQWKVLHVSPNLQATETAEQFGAVRGCLGGSADTTPLKPVSLANPKEGDTRPLPIDLWWDNPNQAKLEIVEWQAGGKDGPNTELMVTHDTNSRAVTQVRATFLRQGVYRVRVWSVANTGRLAMTDWRTFGVLAQ